MSDHKRPLHHYAIALGSNRRHGRHGAPDRVIAAALCVLAAQGVTIEAVARIRRTAAVGPGGRGFANGAAIIGTALEPPAMLARLKAIERAFGRRRGRRWGARVLDLDIILWSGGMWAGRGIGIPHGAFRQRRFVLDPLVEIAADWRDPVSGLHVRHLAARARLRPALERLTPPGRANRRPAWSGS